MFNDCLNACIPVVFLSMYLYSYVSTHSIFELAAGGIEVEFEVWLEMTIK
jgi:hypothetical protein